MIVAAAHLQVGDLVVGPVQIEIPARGNSLPWHPHHAGERIARIDPFDGRGDVTAFRTLGWSWTALTNESLVEVEERSA